MNLQEQEHWDYENGAASEAQNAFAISKMLQGPLTEPRIQQEVDAGKFVVVITSLVYCFSTDAVIGERQTFEGAYDCREAAERAAASYQMEDEERGVIVLPREPRQPIVPDAGWDDVPF